MKHIMRLAGGCLLAILYTSTANANGYLVLPLNTSGAVNSYFDHTSPTYSANGNMTRYDGTVFTGNAASTSYCTLGVGCYDGHNGVDFQASSNTDIYAASDGIIRTIGWDNPNNHNQGYGYLIRLWHSAFGDSTLYAHLTANSQTSGLSVGSTVSQNSVIAKSGNTGSSSGPHLHFSVFNADNKVSSNSIDPHGWTGGGADPWSINQGTLWTSMPPSHSGSTPPVPPTYVSWNFENLDGDSGSIGGHNTDNGYAPGAIEFNSALHTFYVDKTSGDLRHAWDSGGGWQFDVLDGAGGANGRVNADVGYRPSAVVYQGNLHVFYYDNTNKTLRQAISSNGTTWTYFRHFDGASSSISGHTNADVGNPSTAVVDSGGTLGLFYYDYTNGNLRHAWHNSSDWHFENLDGDSGSVAGFTADLGRDPVVKLYNNSIQLFYYDYSNGNLRHAWDSGGGWQFEVLDGTSGSYGGVNADVGVLPEAIEYNGTLQIFYQNATNGLLRHGWSDAGGWHFENLEGDSGSVSGYTSNLGVFATATILNGTLQLFHYEVPSAGGNLRHAWSDAGGWHFENLDGAGGLPSTRVNGDVGHEVKAVTFGGKVHLFYYNATNGNFRHSWNQ